jgi:biotin operon repressor
MVTLRITLLEKPRGKGLREELDWMCKVMGLGRTDSIGTSKLIFERLLEGAQEGRPVGGSELSQELGVSRGSILNLLDRMLRAGVLRREKRGYTLRSKSMLRTVKELEVDIQRAFHRLEEIAREVDKKMGFHEY